MNERREKKSFPWCFYWSWLRDCYWSALCFFFLSTMYFVLQMNIYLLHAVESTMDFSLNKEARITSKNRQQRYSKCILYVSVCFPPVVVSLILKMSTKLAHTDTHTQPHTLWYFLSFFTWFKRETLKKINTLTHIDIDICTHFILVRMNVAFCWTLKRGAEERRLFIPFSGCVYVWVCESVCFLFLVIYPVHWNQIQPKTTSLLFVELCSVAFVFAFNRIIATV